MGAVAVAAQGAGKTRAAAKEREGELGEHLGQLYFRRLE
jgi:hypothetical protein